MSATRKLNFILYFGIALVFFPIGAFVTACRLAYAEGRHYAIQLLAEMLAARKKGGAA